MPEQHLYTCLHPDCDALCSAGSPRRYGACADPEHQTWVNEHSGEIKLEAGVPVFAPLAEESDD